MRILFHKIDIGQNATLNLYLGENGLKKTRLDGMLSYEYFLLYYNICF